MKLNNHGWGLREMLVFSAIIFLFVILAFILINNLYKELPDLTESPETYNQSTSVVKNESNDNSYELIERKLSNAAKRFIAITKEDRKIILSDDLLMGKYITESSLKTSDDICSGYVDINNGYKAYILCNKYETEGY